MDSTPGRAESFSTALREREEAERRLAMLDASILVHYVAEDFRTVERLERARPALRRVAENWDLAVQRAAARLSSDRLRA